MRTLPEWIGKSDDARPPARVRLRVFQHHNGICHISKRKIRPGEPWDLEHVIAIINGGENRESNMAPALRGKSHNEKTARDVAEKSRTYRKRKSNYGIKTTKGRPLPGTRASGIRKRMNGAVERWPQ